jgi:hypothetical protein
MSCFSEIHVSTCIPSTLTSPIWSFPFSFSGYMIVKRFHLLHSCLNNFCRILTMVCWYWTNCTFGLHPSSGVSKNNCEMCSGWVICCHRCLTCFKGLCCVCTQVSGSVVSNWPLREFWTCVLWFLVYIFYSSIFWDTRRWIKSKSTIRSLLKSIWCPVFTLCSALPEGLGCPPYPHQFNDPDDEDRDGLRSAGL